MSVDPVLDFSPDAIRGHFEDDVDDPTVSLSDAELLRAGRRALSDHRVYAAFHAALVDAVEEVQIRRRFSIEPAITSGDFIVYDNLATGVYAIVFSGGNAECQRYMKDNWRVPAEK